MGDYQLQVYCVGYQVNDVYADYLKMGSPHDLSREQVRELAEKNNGKAAVTEHVRIGAGKSFEKEVRLRENEVFLVTLEAEARKEEEGERGWGKGKEGARMYGKLWMRIEMLITVI